ncbi:hypothetical protein C6P45_002600 [Maudiozyma exigua]|uniref:Kinesin motor domain-containing protein n=1 Tax=Maudiozyma exigua TaxID=34358 RepID=A0A9P6WCJ5_MAUEX|nr:hypothetical protein C6P45_002600 [Kazachstania exigua]
MYWGYSNKSALFSSSEASHKLEEDVTAEKKPISVIVRMIPQKHDNKSRLPMFCRPEESGIYLDSNKQDYSSFDRIFGTNSTNEDIYQYFNNDLNFIQNILDAYDTSIITYGQALTGKSSTLLRNQTAQNEDANIGLLPRLSNELFEKLEKERTEKNTKYVVKLNVFEVSMEKIYDMLAMDEKKKSLKLHHENNKLEYTLKGLTNEVISSTDDIISQMRDVSKRRQVDSKKQTRSTTHLFVKLNVEQRNVVDETLKIGNLLLVDLCGSNLLDKEKDKKIASSDEIKKINSEIKAVNHVIKMLHEHQTKHPNDNTAHSVPYRDSSLTKLLINSIAGNSITAFLTCCSTDKIDEMDSINSLKTSSTIKKIHTQVYPNIVGLHQKKKMCLLYENMKTKEENYLKRIKQLEEERNTFRETYDNPAEGQSNKTTSQKLQKSEAENKALIEQLELLKSLLNKPSDGSKMNQKALMGNTIDITNSLIEKSSKVAELQASIEEMNHTNYILKEKLKRMGGIDSNLEQMNNKLVAQIKEHEKLIHDLLTANAAMESELDHFKEINKVRNDKVKILEDRVSKVNINGASYDNTASMTPRQGSISSSSGHTIVPIEEEKEIAPSSWGLKNTTWGTRQASVGSIGITTSEETFVPRPLKKGLKLNSVRVVSGPATSPHTVHSKM